MIISIDLNMIGFEIALTHMKGRSRDEKPAGSRLGEWSLAVRYPTLKRGADVSKPAGSRLIIPGAVAKQKVAR
jgi:hypothetical protein